MDTINYNTQLTVDTTNTPQNTNKINNTTQTRLVVGIRSLHDYTY